MTLWRIQFLQEILKSLPEVAFEKVSDRYIPEPDLMLKKKSGIVWLDTLLDQIRWYSSLFPGREQCQDQLEAWNLVYQKLYNVILWIKENPEVDQALIKVVDCGMRAMQRNRWVFDFLRPDQLELVKSSRANLASLGLDYLPVYEATKAQFAQKPNFNFFLNSPVFNEKVGEQEGLSNVNLIGAATGSGKTRCSIISSIGHLCFSNEVIPYAAQRLGVFVRTRSQTQSFLKESKRLGLSACCPISVSLGCQAHNKQTNKFLDNLFVLFEKLKEIQNGISLKLGKDQVLQISTRIPIELYPNVARKTDTCVSLAQGIEHLMELCKDEPTAETFIHQWKKMVKDKSENSHFKDLKEFLNQDLEGELRNAKVYLRAEGKCKRCPANPKYSSGLGGLEEDQELMGSSLQPKQFFNQRMDKDADINKIAEDFQQEFGFCGRTESKKTMETADVVIFTYNWLMDPCIAPHAHKALKTHPTKGLNPRVAVVCDEAHYLYDYNEDITVSFQNLFKLAGELWHAKIHYLDQTSFNIPGLKDSIVPPKNEYGEEWQEADQSLWVVLTFLEKFCTLEGNDTPTNLFCLATGHKSAWYPEALYKPHMENFSLEHRKDPIGSTYKVLENMLSKFEGLLSNLSGEIEELEDSIQDVIEKEESIKPLPRWIRDAISIWKAGGRKNGVNFQRVLGRVACGVQESLVSSYSFLRDFTTLLREVVYSVSQGSFDDRILAISQGFPNSNNIYGVNVFEGGSKPVEEPDQKKIARAMSHYLRVLSTVGKALTREWDTAGVDELIRFYHQGGGVLRGLELKHMYRKELRASFKVNRPHVQTALRPYPYISFLTGTPAESQMWKTKSGFRYLVTSEYPNYKSEDHFDIQIDDRFELKQATKGEALFRSMAQAIQEHTRTEKTLVGYPSKKTMNEIAEFFPEEYKKSVILENPELSLDQIQAYFEKDGVGSVHLVCSGRYCEGIEFSDVNGSSLVKKAIIVGVPFNTPSEQADQIQNYYAKQFGWDKWDLMKMFLYAPAATKIRQFMGRIVRNLTDHGTVILMDTRYKSSKMLRNALKL